MKLKYSMEKLGAQSTKAVISLKRGKIELKLLLTAYTKSYTRIRGIDCCQIQGFFVADIREIRLVIYSILSLRSCQL